MSILQSLLIEILRSKKITLVVRPSTSHSRIPNVGLSLKIFQALGLSDGVQILNMLSMNPLKNSIFFLYLGSNVFPLWYT